MSNNTGIYDAYHKKWLKNGIIGTLTTNSMTSTTHRGTYFITIEIKQEKPGTDMENEVTEIKVRQATKNGYAVARLYRDSVNLTAINSKTRRGRVGVDVANTLDTGCSQGIFVQISKDLEVYAVWYPKKQCYIAIRKLTPKECFRLQGWGVHDGDKWNDEYFEKAQFVCSDSQLFKQAGNGVTVDVIRAIANNMCLDNNNKLEII